LGDRSAVYVWHPFPLSSSCLDSSIVDFVMLICVCLMCGDIGYDALRSEKSLVEVDIPEGTTVDVIGDTHGEPLASILIPHADAVKLIHVLSQDNSTTYCISLPLLDLRLRTTSCSSTECVLASVASFIFTFVALLRRSFSLWLPGFRRPRIVVGRGRPDSLRVQSSLPQPAVP
jgi:hypothetical protein